MDRLMRRYSIIGVDHVMLRGINKMTIFEDTVDEDKYLELHKIYIYRCGLNSLVIA